MKALTNSDDLQTIIETLNNLLMEGHLKYTRQNQIYFDNKATENFEINKYITECTDILNTWFTNVVEVLEKQLKDKHHLFHFIQHKSAGLVKGGMPADLSNVQISFEYFLYALEDIILRLEERKNLAIRQEIAEKERETDILYKISYSEHTREIKLNNILLAKLQTDSKNVNFFEYVFTHPNELLLISDIEKATACSLSDNVHDILRDLNFKANTKTVFFPIATKIKVMFMNPITKHYAIKNDLPIVDIFKLTRQNEK